MKTTVFTCGCSITRSMFGEQELISVSPCARHAKDVQPQLERLAEAVEAVASGGKALSD